MKIEQFAIPTIVLMIIASSMIGCNKTPQNNGENQDSNADAQHIAQNIENTYNKVPSIYESSIFDVNATYNIVYGQGLSRSDINSDDYKVMDLKLDLYQPVDAPDNRPAFVYIHGGSFRTGDKDSYIVDRFADYYVSRGFVFISINYRLFYDYGNSPDTWVKAMDENKKETNIDFFHTLYPCVRDAKAAVRWLYANSHELGVNTDYITVSGDSAGAFISVALALTQDEEFRDEISIEDDPTLESTHIQYSSKVRTVVDYWGGKGIVDIFDSLEGTYSYDSSDPPIIIIHGDVDKTVPFSNAEALVFAYETMDVEAVFYPLNKAGHSCWWVEIDGEPMEAAVFKDIVRIQELVIK